MRIKVIDSHTAGEPTRVVVEGGPKLTVKGARAVRELLQKEDWMRRSLILEPRGHEAMVGACLCEPEDESCVAGVVFFNNTSYLNGCLHGTMGVMVTLAHLGKIGEGVHKLETPVGVIEAELKGNGQVTVGNVPSYRWRTGVAIDVPGHGKVVGDIAWGGNWFYLIDNLGPTVCLDNREELTDFTWAVMQALEKQGYRGEDGGLIDHVEVFGPPVAGVEADSQNFVMCPGKAYDRSPCGTGTSAKIACLAASGKVAEGEVWRQAGILGTVFEGTYRALGDGRVRPEVTGQAHVTGLCEWILDEEDPFRFGIGANAAGASEEKERSEVETLAAGPKV
ncbi:MAG: proline racemase family protein [Verrucomicrobiota bacterium JB023]|nr:proline racemase family protein [Verrucomicrobiota bacterium JB023]